jgi:Dolichyl-phosphate-mannose-protein mannosyltransferase
MLAERRARVWLWLVAGATIAIRLWFTVVHRIDSDEPQHLHVLWAWTQGLVQYRDVFDNHLPLLHLLFAPVMALMPENSSVFLLMRLAIAPFAIASAWLVYVAAKPHYGAVNATAAALIFSVIPPWLIKSVEFRNDTLWMFFWLAALALIANRRSPFLAGIAMGLCLLASIKTVPLVLAHVLAFATQRPRITLRDIVQWLAGAAVPTSIVALMMLALGAFDEMVYATLFFNAAVPVEAWRRIGGAVAFLFVAPSIWFAGQRIRDRVTVTTAHLILFACFYIALLLAFWPILTPRDFLPLMAIVALGLAQWNAGVPPAEQAPSRRRSPDRGETPLAQPAGRRRSTAVLVLLAAVWSYIDARLWRPTDYSRHEFVDAAVRVTAPTDYILDLKGDAVFRRRPIYYIYEDVGRALTAEGKIDDHGPEQIVAKRCCAAVRDTTHLPPRTRAFLNRYFIGSGPIRVCGANVRGSTFEIGVPQTYTVIADGPVLLDGTPYQGPRKLNAGRHTLSGVDRAVVIWSRATSEAAPPRLAARAAPRRPAW